MEQEESKNSALTLDAVRPGATVRVAAVGGEGALRRRLLDMGITPGTVVTLTKTAPLGDPIQISLRGYELTLRLADAEKIVIKVREGLA